MAAVSKQFINFPVTITVFSKGERKAGTDVEG